MNLANDCADVPVLWDVHGRAIPASFYATQRKLIARTAAAIAASQPSTGSMQVDAEQAVEKATLIVWEVVQRGARA